MLAIKKRPWQLPILVWLAAVWIGLSGCKPPGVQSLLEGEQLVRQGKYPEAVNALQKAARLLPTNAQAFNHLGLAFHGSGQLEQAGRAYRQALSLDHQLAAARYNLGCLHLELGNPAAAIDELTSYTMLQPKSVPGWLKLGSAQLRSRHFEAAEAAYKSVLQLEQNHPEALNGLGVLNVQRKRPFDALSFFNQALARKVNYAPALLNLAVLAHQHLHNPQLALEKYRAYLALDPRPANWEDVATVAERVRTELTKAQEQPTPVEEVPAAPQIAQTPPSAEQATAPSRSETAPQIPKPAAPLRLPSPPTPTQLTNPPAQHRAPSIPSGSPPQASTPPTAAPSGGIRYRYLSPGRPAKGDRREAEKQLQLGLRAHRAGRTGEALSYYDSAAQADPSYFDARFNQGLAALQVGKVRSALQACEYALALRPDSSDARFNFALALKQASYPWDAAVELEKLVKARPKEVLVRLSLANLYAQQLNQPSLARNHYRKALELAPRHPEAARIRSWLARNP